MLYNDLCQLMCCSELVLSTTVQVATYGSIKYQITCQVDRWIRVHCSTVLHVVYKNMTTIIFIAIVGIQYCTTYCTTVTLEFN